MAVGAAVGSGVAEDSGVAVGVGAMVGVAPGSAVAVGVGLMLAQGDMVGSSSKNSRETGLGEGRVVKSVSLE
ncbi:unknown [Firmicutes bacterium CAG:534]|nr:unknown [Firmicutes bacterium CAG:534]